MKKTTEGVEEHIDKSMADIGNKTQEASDRISKLSPQLDALTRGLATMEDTIYGDLNRALKVS
jgi:hypothetical protein